MSDDRQSDVADLLKQAGLGWLLDPTGDNAKGLLCEIDRAEVEYARRFGSRVDLLAECRRRPDHLRPFLQTLAAGVSPSLLTMVARIILWGSDLIELHFDYTTRQSASLRVVIADQEGRQTFESSALTDAWVLRHLGFMMVDGKPVIDGYYTLRTSPHSA